MIQCDTIYLFTANGFAPGGIGRQTCTKIGKRQLYTKGETIHKTKQKPRVHKTENRHTNKETNKTILKNINRVIRN